MLFVGTKIAPQRWRYSQYLQEPRRHKRFRYFFGKNARSFRPIIPIVSAHHLERGVHPIPILQSNRRHKGLRTLSLGVVLTEAHQLVAVGERQWSQQNRVDGGEDGAVGADGESEGEDHRDRESGRFPDESEGGCKLGDRGVERADAVEVSQFFLER